MFPGRMQITLDGSLRSIDCNDCSERLASVHPDSANHFRMSASRSLLLVGNDFSRLSTTVRGSSRKGPWPAAEVAAIAQAIATLKYRSHRRARRGAIF